MIWKFIDGAFRSTVGSVESTRRQFLGGALAAFAMPAVVKIEHVDRVRGIILPRRTWAILVDPYSHTMLARNWDRFNDDMPPGWKEATDATKRILDHCDRVIAHRLRRIECGMLGVRVPLQTFGINESLVPQKQHTVPKFHAPENPFSTNRHDLGIWGGQEALTPNLLASRRKFDHDALCAVEPQAFVDVRDKERMECLQAASAGNTGRSSS